MVNISKEVLDNDELENNDLKLSFPRLERIEKIIKLLSVIFIIISGVVLIQQIYFYWSASIYDRYSNSNLIGVFMLMCSFALPFLYFNIWKNTLDSIRKKDKQRLKKNYRISALILIPNVLTAFAWLFYALAFIYFMMTGMKLRFPTLLLVIGLLLLVVNHALQIWFYRETLSITEKYKKEFYLL